MTKLSTGWVDLGIGLGWEIFRTFCGLGRVVCRKNFQKFSYSLHIYVCNFYRTVRFVNLQLGASPVLTVVMFLRNNMTHSCFLCVRRSAVGCMEFDWTVGWVGFWVQSFHIAMGWPLGWVESVVWWIGLGYDTIRYEMLF